jgi:transcriptional regulator with XRE-family HTH domain
MPVAKSSSESGGARAPLPLLNLRMKMLRRNLSLREVSKRAGVPYVSASAILNGRLVQPTNLEKLSAAIESVPVIPDLSREEYLAQLREIAGRQPQNKISQPGLTKA